MENTTPTTKGLNGYVCFWRGKRIEVYSDTSYHAQQEAQKQFGKRCRKGHEIAVVLAEKNGEEVVHTPDF